MTRVSVLAGGLGVGTGKVHQGREQPGKGSGCRVHGPEGQPAALAGGKGWKGRWGGPSRNLYQGTLFGIWPFPWETLKDGLIFAFWRDPSAPAWVLGGRGQRRCWEAG